MTRLGLRSRAWIGLIVAMQVQEPAGSALALDAWRMPWDSADGVSGELVAVGSRYRSWARVGDRMVAASEAGVVEWFDPQRMERTSVTVLPSAVIRVRSHADGGALATTTRGRVYRLESENSSPILLDAWEGFRVVDVATGPAGWPPGDLTVLLEDRESEQVFVARRATGIFVRLDSSAWRWGRNWSTTLPVIDSESRAWLVNDFFLHYFGYVDTETGEVVGPSCSDYPEYAASGFAGAILDSRGLPVLYGGGGHLGYTNCLVGSPSHGGAEPLYAFRSLDVPVLDVVASLDSLAAMAPVAIAVHMERLGESESYRLATYHGLYETEDRFASFERIQLWPSKGWNGLTPSSIGAVELTSWSPFRAIVLAGNGVFEIAGDQYARAVLGPRVQGYAVDASSTPSGLFLQVLTDESPGRGHLVISSEGTVLRLSAPETRSWTGWTSVRSLGREPAIWTVESDEKISGIYRREIRSRDAFGRERRIRLDSQTDVRVSTVLEDSRERYWVIAERGSSGSGEVAESLVGAVLGDQVVLSDATLTSMRSTDFEPMGPLGEYEILFSPDDGSLYAVGIEDGKPKLHALTATGAHEFTAAVIHDATLIAATPHAVWRFDPDALAWSEWAGIPLDEHTEVLHLCRTGDGALWIVTGEAVLRSIDGRRPTLIPLLWTEFDTTRVVATFADATDDRAIWLRLQGGGLLSVRVES